MDLEQKAIERIRTASEMSLKIYQKPLVVTFSGGKDSSVCLALTQKANIPFTVQHNHTTVDAPETVYFVRSEYKRLENIIGTGGGESRLIIFPHFKGQRTTMWDLIPEVGVPPTRLKRYCCMFLKEGIKEGAFNVSGVRWAESTNRRSRGTFETLAYDRNKRVVMDDDNDESRHTFETCQLKSSRSVNPIIDWSNNDVWDYIHAEHLPVNPLYGCGFDRVGCVGCPLSTHRKRSAEFAKYPTYERAYIRAFDKMLEVRKMRGKTHGRGAREFNEDWTCGEEVFHWWMGDNFLPGQITMPGYE